MLYKDITFTVHFLNDFILFCTIVYSRPDFLLFSGPMIPIEAGGNQLWGEERCKLSCGPTTLVHFQHERLMLVASISIFASCTMQCTVELLKNVP